MNQRNLEKYGLSTFALKIIAVVTMIIDHTAILYFGKYHGIYFVMRMIGRISFPLFCFVLTEGFFHTRDRKRYAFRLFIFALISEIPYNIFAGHLFDPGRQNVLFTFLIGFLTIWAMDSIEKSKIKYSDKLLKYINLNLLNMILEFVVVMIGIAATYLIRPTYSYTGVVLIILFYVTHEHAVGQLLSNMVFNMGLYKFSSQWFGIVSAIPIALYNGKPGCKKGKYFFYLFYPVHLIALLAIKFVLKQIF